MKFCTCSPFNWAMRLAGVKSLAQLRSEKSVRLCLAGARKLLCNCIAKLALFVQCVSPLTLPFPFYTRTHTQLLLTKLNGPSSGPSLPSLLFGPLTRHGWRSLVSFTASLTAAVCVILRGVRCTRSGRPWGAGAKMGQRQSTAKDLDETPEVLSTISGGGCLLLSWRGVLCIYSNWFYTQSFNS